MPPRFSVFTSCFNQASYLPEAIESVLGQTFSDFEYLIYDDGSADGSWEVIERYAAQDTRIKAFKLEKTPNVGVVINKSIDESIGDYWTWCPADDIWLPRLLEEKEYMSREYPDAVIYNDWLIINKDGRQIGQHRVRAMTPESFRQVVWRDSPIGFTGICIPRIVFNRAGKFPEHLRFSEDFYWMIKATIHNVAFRGLNKILHKKRKHGGTLSAQNRKKILAQVPKIRKELAEYRSNLTDSTDV